VDRLDDRLTLLTGARPRAGARHSALAATIDWSYRLLSDEARAVFDRLGAFPASFDLDAAIAVCAGREPAAVTAVVGDLVAKSLVVIEGLLERGARVRAHDPVATDRARAILGDRVEFEDHNYDCLEGADALFICTEWQPYRRPDFKRMLEAMRSPVVFDGRNLYSPDRMQEMEFEYSSIGRPAVRGAYSGDSGL
jgi:hypothetical protein